MTKEQEILEAVVILRNTLPAGGSQVDYTADRSQVTFYSDKCENLEEAFALLRAYGCRTATVFPFESYTRVTGTCKTFNPPIEIRLLPNFTIPKVKEKKDVEVLLNPYQETL